MISKRKTKPLKSFLDAVWPVTQVQLSVVMSEILEHRRENTASVARFRGGGDGVSRKPPPKSRHNSAPGRARAGSSAESLVARIGRPGSAIFEIFGCARRIVYAFADFQDFTEVRRPLIPALTDVPIPLTEDLAGSIWKKATIYTFVTKDGDTPKTQTMLLALAGREGLGLTYLNFENHPDKLTPPVADAMPRKHGRTIMSKLTFMTVIPTEERSGTESALTADSPIRTGTARLSVKDGSRRTAGWPNYSFPGRIWE